MRLGGRLGAIIFRMVIDRDEFRPQTIPQFRAFLASTLEVHFCVPDSDDARYAHIGWPTQPPPHAPSEPRADLHAPGLRIGELLNATRGKIEGDAHDDHWLHLVGKGSNAGKV